MYWIRRMFTKIKNKVKNILSTAPSSKSIKPNVPVKPSNAKYAIPRSWKRTALEITSSFEGQGFDQVTNDFDKQIMSCGALQWCYGQNSLQEKILQPAIERYGADYINTLFMGVDIASTAYMSPNEVRAFFKKNGINPNKLTFTFISQWRGFLLLIRDIQIEAADEIAQKAYSYIDMYNLPKDCQTFCFCFDVVVQNGSFKGIRPPIGSSYYRDLTKDAGKNREIWGNLKPTQNAMVLYTWICARANKNKWRWVVIERKGTLAHGVGKVYGQYRDYREKFKQADLNHD